LPGNDPPSERAKTRFCGGWIIETLLDAMSNLQELLANIPRGHWAALSHGLDRVLAHSPDLAPSKTKQLGARGEVRFQPNEVK